MADTIESFTRNGSTRESWRDRFQNKWPYLTTLMYVSESDTIQQLKQHSKSLDCIPRNTSVPSSWSGSSADLWTGPKSFDLDEVTLSANSQNSRKKSRCDKVCSTILCTILIISVLAAVLAGIGLSIMLSWHNRDKDDHLDQQMDAYLTVEEETYLSGVFCNLMKAMLKRVDFPVKQGLDSCHAAMKLVKGSEDIFIEMHVQPADGYTLKEKIRRAMREIILGNGRTNSTSAFITTNDNLRKDSKSNSTVKANKFETPIGVSQTTGAYVSASLNAESMHDITYAKARISRTTTVIGEIVPTRTILSDVSSFANFVQAGPIPTSVSVKPLTMLSSSTTQLQLTDSYSSFRSDQMQLSSLPTPSFILETSIRLPTSSASFNKSTKALYTSKTNIDETSLSVTLDSTPTTVSAILRKEFETSFRKTSLNASHSEKHTALLAEETKAEPSLVPTFSLSAKSSQRLESFSSLKTAKKTISESSVISTVSFSIMSSQSLEPFSSLNTAEETQVKPSFVPTASFSIISSQSLEPFSPLKAAEETKVESRVIPTASFSIMSSHSLEPFLPFKTAEKAKVETSVDSTIRFPTLYSQSLEQFSSSKKVDVVIASALEELDVNVHTDIHRLTLNDKLKATKMFEPTVDKNSERNTNVKPDITQVSLSQKKESPGIVENIMFGGVVKLPFKTNSNFRFLFSSDNSNSLNKQSTHTRTSNKKTNKDFYSKSSQVKRAENAYQKPYAQKIVDVSELKEIKQDTKTDMAPIFPKVANAISKAKNVFAFRPKFQSIEPKHLIDVTTFGDQKEYRPK